MASALDEMMRGPPYTPRSTWPKVAVDPVKAHKTRLHRLPVLPATAAEDRSEDRAKGGMLRAVRAAT